MGVRPPTTNEHDDAEDVEFGIAAVDARLSDASVPFPATASDVVEELSDPQVPYDPKGNAVALSTALERTSRDRFESRSDLLNALHPVFEELRTSRTPGVVSRVLSWLPV